MLLERQYVQAKHTSVFKQFWTKSTQEANNIFSFFFFLVLTSVTPKEKKRRICIRNFRRVQLLGDPFTEKVNSYELHSLNVFQYKH